MAINLINDDPTNQKNRQLQTLGAFKNILFVEGKN
jgi:hypothetical protein